MIGADILCNFEIFNPSSSGHRRIAQRHEEGDYCGLHRPPLKDLCSPNEEVEQGEHQYEHRVSDMTKPQRDFYRCGFSHM